LTLVLPGALAGDEEEADEEVLPSNLPAFVAINVERHLETIARASGGVNVGLARIASRG